MYNFAQNYKSIFLYTKHLQNLHTQVNSKVTKHHTTVGVEYVGIHDIPRIYKTKMWNIR